MEENIIREDLEYSVMSMSSYKELEGNTEVWHILLANGSYVKKDTVCIFRYNSKDEDMAVMQLMNDIMAIYYDDIEWTGDHWVKNGVHISTEEILNKIIEDTNKTGNFILKFTYKGKSLLNDVKISNSIDINNIIQQSIKNDSIEVACL